MTQPSHKLAARVAPGVYLRAARNEPGSYAAGKFIGWEIISVQKPASPHDCAVSWYGWEECTEPRYLSTCTRRARQRARHVATVVGLPFLGTLPEEVPEQAERDTRSEDKP